MSFLENKKVVHRDLRAENVLVAANNSIKVADFGMARIISDEMCIAKVVKGKI